MSKSDLVDETREYTTQEAAELVGFDPSYFRRMLIDGRLEGRNVGGRIWFIDGQSLKSWLVKREAAE